ncbi:hypothetical protein [Achromobacter aloeverae]
MALYLLDKNVVEDIRKSLKSIPTSGVKLTRSVDRKGNTVSPLLAILEGSIRKAQAPDEVHSGILADAQAVGMFYRHARTDAKGLKAIGVAMTVTLGPHWREKTAALVPLGKELQLLLSRTYSTADARNVLAQIASLCEMYSVERAHPLITCAVACLYGNSGARKVLKPMQSPSGGDSYNAIADIRMIMETAYIRQIWQKYSPREPVKLLSGDKNLNEFSKTIGVVAASNILLSGLSFEAVNFRSTISSGLFPALEMKPKEMAHVFQFFHEGEEAHAGIQIIGANATPVA